MKVSLVVATGAHEGRVISLTGSQFLIGRDPQCHLRPASPAISKVHCAVVIRDGKVYLKDYGSTNGTRVNNELVQSAEVAIEDGAAIQVGPLDFRVKIEKLAAKTDGTPLPGDSPETAAALAAVKAATAASAASAAPARDTTPAPAKSAAVPQPAVKPAAPTKPGAPKEAATKPAAAKETPTLTPSKTTGDEDNDRIAAMLLGMDDEGNGSVPEGSTVMELPTLAGEAAKANDKDKDKKDTPKKAQTREEMTNAANDLLRQYKRRPK